MFLSNIHPFLLLIGWFDENGCTPSYEGAYIVFGIIVGVLGLVAVVSIVMVLYLWIGKQNKRVLPSSPRFLIFIFGSAIVGFISMATIVGKPDNPQCVSHIWLFNFVFIAIC